jgi:hypothetical protein
MASTNVIIKTTGGKIEILAAAAITNEDCRTSEFIFDFVLTICQQLSTTAFVLLVDGDRATWLAARNKFQFILMEYNRVQKHNSHFCNAGGCSSMLISCIGEHEEKIWSIRESPCRQAEVFLLLLVIIIVFADSRNHIVRDTPCRRWCMLRGKGDM